ncbi:MAG: hypothetical protein IPN34_08610 [Planctomycetes bacterium]|nr:hypothetical protein [Planctomycetota bacterium]
MSRSLLAFAALALLLGGSAAWLVRIGESARERAVCEGTADAQLVPQRGGTRCVRARWTASAEGASMKGTRGDAEPRVLRLAR